MRNARGRLTAVALVLALLSLSAPVPGAAAPRAAFPEVSLPRHARGEAAVRALGERLPEVAAAYGLTPAEFARTLRQDGHSRLDRRGRLLYVDAAAGSPPPGDVGAAEAALLPAALSDTFQLHSRPGAKQVIFIDVDGHRLSNAWADELNGGQDIVAPPWDISGGASVFTDAERTLVQQVWQRVAEDYAPFDVDVTTEYTGENALTRSGTDDEYYGLRVLVSPISYLIGGAGGVAYVGCFNDTDDYYKTALVFPENLGNSDKNVGEAVAHEAGHTFGLRHDGTTTGIEYYEGHGSGTTGWAPVMGCGYYRSVTQWSRGEYENANNHEDDLAVISGMVGYRPDDRGSERSSALRLEPPYPVSVSGVVERNTDTDVYALTVAAGVLSVTASPAERGPDLDIALEVHDADGVMIASGKPASTLAASASGLVGAGTYYVSVRGSGAGASAATGYSTYGSLGAYSLRVTAAAPPVPQPPVPRIRVTPSSGTAPVEMSFDAGESYDPDGAIASYAWDFGDGTSASGVAVTHTYASPGSYTVRLTVTDDDGMSATAASSVSVYAYVPPPPPNQAPVAVTAATPTWGTAPLSVTFGSAGSFDGDGSIASWSWDFGDGSSASGPSATHVYTRAGEYQAVLTVTDDDGALALSVVRIVVVDPPKIPVRVSSLGLSVSYSTLGARVKAIARVETPEGVAVPGAVVHGRWGGALSGSATAVTDAEGRASVTSLPSRTGGTASFTVTGVDVPEGYTREGVSDPVSSATIAATWPLKVKLPAPRAPLSVTAGAPFVVAGTFTPTHTDAWPKRVRVELWQLVGGVYRFRRSVLSAYPSAGSYRATVSIPSRGTWVVRAFHPGDGIRGATRSAPRRVVVR